MGNTFSRAVVALGHEKCLTRCTYRDDGSLATETQIVLRVKRGVRSILYCRHWCDQRGRSVVSQEAELRESDDTKIIRRTWHWNEQGQPIQGEIQTVFLAPTRQQQSAQLPPLFSAPDMALNSFLLNSGVDVSEINAPRPEPPQLSFRRSDPTTTEWERFINRTTHKALVEPEE